MKTPYLSASSARSSVRSRSPSMMTSLRATFGRSTAVSHSKEKPDHFCFLCKLHLKSFACGWKAHLLVFAVGLLSNVLGLFKLDLLQLHLLLILHGPVLNDLHASVCQETVSWRCYGRTPPPDVQICNAFAISLEGGRSCCCATDENSPLALICSLLSLLQLGQGSAQTLLSAVQLLLNQLDASVQRSDLCLGLERQQPSGQPGIQQTLTHLESTRTHHISPKNIVFCCGSMCTPPVFYIVAKCFLTMLCGDNLPRSHSVTIPMSHSSLHRQRPWDCYTATGTEATPWIIHITQRYLNGNKPSHLQIIGYFRLV